MPDYVDRESVIRITAETGALETQRRVRDLPAVDVELSSKDKKFTFTDLILNLYGNIEPVADAHIDSKHLENLKWWCDIHCWITDKLVEVASADGLMCYGSAKEIIDYAREYLRESYGDLSELLDSWK